MASLFADESRNAVSSKVSLKCFCESFNGISNDPAHLSDLPPSSKTIDGLGVLINLTGRQRWQPFATWVIKLICKCLTEGTLYVEGLVNVSFVSAACSLLCYGDSDLHMVGTILVTSWLLEYRLLLLSLYLISSFVLCVRFCLCLCLCEL